MLSLVIAPHPILRQVAVALPLPPDDEVRALAIDMFSAMEHYRGIGLAAPQVGRSIRLIAIATPGGPTAYVNPEIVRPSWRKVDMEEGCLSLPGVFGVVRRPERVNVRYLTLDGQPVQEELSGMIARVYQHEVDHLNGVLFIDRTKRIDQGQELLSTYGAA